MHPPSADRPSGGAGRFLQFSGLVRPDSARQPDAPKSSLPLSQAAADTLAECELLQRIWPKVAAQCTSWRDVQRLAAQHRWLARAG